MVEFSDGSTFVMDYGGHMVPGSPAMLAIAHERLCLSPEHLLLTALNAPDIHLEPTLLLQGLAQDVVAFTLDGAPVRVILNPYTHLPTAVDYSGPLARSGFWRYVGDVTMRVSFSFWWITKGGIRMPMQWNIEANGLPDSEWSVKSLSIDNILPQAEFAIPDDIRAAFQAASASPKQMRLGNPALPSHELAPGIVFIPGPWNCTLIRQTDGVVILEGPISSEYSALALDEAKKRFPDLPVKAVVSTSDSWPHIAGLRTYVARSIPIYILNLNKPIVQRLLANPFSSKPDELADHPKESILRLVEAKFFLGDGTNRLEIYPIRGETSERQMVVYFPEHHLLYTSDAFQQFPNGEYFYPQTVSEVIDAAAREHLSVQTFFSMHINPTPWIALAGVVSNAASSDTPNGKL